MISLDFEWQTNEFMLYCRTTQLREKSMMAYEQSLKLFERWCRDEMGIFTVDKVTENVIRRYISELQERGKYTFYRIDKQKKGGRGIPCTVDIVCNLYAGSRKIMTEREAVYSENFRGRDSLCVYFDKKRICKTATRIELFCQKW